MKKESKRTSVETESQKSVSKKPKSAPAISFDSSMLQGLDDLFDISDAPLPPQRQVPGSVGDPHVKQFVPPPEALAAIASTVSGGKKKGTKSGGTSSSKKTIAAVEPPIRQDTFAFSASTPNLDEVVGVPYKSADFPLPIQQQPSLAAHLPLQEYINRWEPTIQKTTEQLIADFKNKLRGYQMVIFEDRKKREEPIYASPGKFPIINTRMAQVPYNDQLLKLVKSKKPAFPSVPVISRHYILKYRRPADLKRGERPCASRAECLSLNLPNHPMEAARNKCFSETFDALAPIRAAFASSVSSTPSSLRGGSDHGASTTAASAIPMNATAQFSPDNDPAAKLLILREFLLPDQENAFHKTNTLPDVPGRCIVCIIFETTSLYFGYRQSQTECPDCLQSFQVEVDKPGEYNKNACLPIVSNNLMTGIQYPFPKYEHHHWRWEKDQAGQYNVREINMDFR